jgi:hypothetical protein
MFGRIVLKAKPGFLSLNHFHAARSLSVLDAAYTLYGFCSAGVSLLQAASTAASFHVPGSLVNKVVFKLGSQSSLHTFVHDDFLIWTGNKSSA